MSATLSCWDCAMFRGAYDVDCLRHTPEAKRAAREAKVAKAVAEATKTMMKATHPWFTR